MSAQDSVPRMRILPPHIVRREFLPADTVARLLAWTKENQARFKPATVGRDGKGVVRPEARISTRLHDFGPLKSELESILRPLAPGLAAELKVEPFETAHIELELVAHGDGAFYSRHIDTAREDDDRLRSTRRLLSGVYYFHAMPKAFEGGALRLHEILTAQNDPQFVDIQPEHNSLVFFPAWMPHEVMKVSCPSGRFRDSRFAINCWFHGKLG